MIQRKLESSRENGLTDAPERIFDLQGSITKFICSRAFKNVERVYMCCVVLTCKNLGAIKAYAIGGHSFLPCDREFSIIKRALKKLDRIYNVHDLTEIIANASRTQKFEVREVNTIEITNSKAWWPGFYKKNAVSLETRNLERTQKVHFNISKFHYFVYDSERSETVKAAEFIKGEVEHTFDLNQSENNIVLLLTTPCYPVGKVPVKQNKIDEIRQCIK
nr:unnamed protein product [Callosobruchus chinensis]